MEMRSRTLAFCMLLLIGLLLALPVLAQEPPATEIPLTPIIALDELMVDSFSNFSSRLVPYSQVTDEVLRSARNRLRPFCAQAPVCLPVAYESAANASTWLQPDSLVIGYSDASGQAYAYPLQIMLFHGLVNDTIGNEPILVVYSMYTNHASIYSRRSDGQILEFGNSGIYYSSIPLMYDLQTESQWLQLNGQQLVGSVPGQQLELLPFVVMPWLDWQAIHPNTVSLARRANYVDYRNNPAANYRTSVNLGRFAFPVTRTVQADRQLRYADQVYVVTVGDETAVFPVNALADGITPVRIGDTDVLLLRQTVGGEPVLASHLPLLEDGTPVMLVYDEVAVEWWDRETGTVFEITGQAISGQFSGQRIVSVPATSMYWFAALAAYPNLTLYSEITAP